MLKLCITGANGFVGKAIVSKLCKTNLLSLVGRSSELKNDNYHCIDINAESDFSSALVGVDVVIHCAAKVHVMKNNIAGAEQSYIDVNTLGTINLAKQAVKAGVKRFIFLSSIKVNGESTSGRAPFSYDDELKPLDYYGISKARAESGLWEIAKNSGMEVVIIRPPLVYGPGVKANFAALMKAAKHNIPLPFGRVNNSRSLVCIDNLVDLIVTCISHPKAANQVFLASDGHDLSTKCLFEMMVRATGKSQD